jgi:tetratricopeptide (TPR) repeat protein
MNQLGRVNLAMKHLSNGQVPEAAQLSSQLLAEASTFAPAHYLACEVAIAQNQAAQALNHINRAIEIDGRQPVLQLKKAHIEVICRQGQQAQETASAVAARFPDDPAIQLEAARVFIECGNHVGAETFLLNAGAKDAKNSKYLFAFSTNQFFLGKTAEAEKAISDYLDLQLPVIGRKLLLRAQLRKQTQSHNHVEMLKNYLTRPLPKKEAVNCYYALAKELEDLGDYEQSFEALISGAAIQHRLVDIKLADELKNIKDLINTFQPDNFARIHDSNSEDAPIFIVGMPRSGTTLVEHIINRCEGVRSAEETNDFTLAFSSVINDRIAANRDRYLNPLSAALEVNYNEVAHNYRNSMLGMLGKADRYMDKTPFNFLYCGLIKKAFPKARILHLVRDPMDTCYAVFKTLFDQSYFYSYDMGELADYYIGYRQLMDHWHNLMPDAILDVRYENLVSNPLDVSKRIADYVGFDWSKELIEVESSTVPCSTASAAQVREPIYTSSVGLWRNFETELEPVRRKLSAANIVDRSGAPLI